MDKEERGVLEEEMRMMIEERDVEKLGVHLVS